MEVLVVEEGKTHLERQDLETHHQHLHLRVVTEELERWDLVVVAGERIKQGQIALVHPILVATVGTVLHHLFLVFQRLTLVAVVVAQSFFRGRLLLALVALVVVEMVGRFLITVCRELQILVGEVVVAHNMEERHMLAATAALASSLSNTQ